MGFIAEIMERKLRDRGVVFEQSKKTKIDFKNKLIIKTDESSISTSKIFLATELDDALKFFDNFKIRTIQLLRSPNIFYFQNK